MAEIDPILRLVPVIPVLTVRAVEDAVPIAQALVAGGLAVLEVTLRTPAALAVIAEMARVPGAVVGAGTVLNEADVEASLKAGARFLVSPGLTESLAGAARAADAPFLPGIATAGDVMRGLDLGLSRFKFFPAEAAGGVRALAALSAPFAQCRFCPTGGIGGDAVPAWLALPSVLCLGGSWIVPPGAPDAAAITGRARAAVQRARAAGRSYPL